MASAKENLPALFRTLADPTRLRLLNLISQGDVCVCHLTDSLEAIQPRVSRHLAYLRRAGVVETRREGKWMHYRWAPNGEAFAGYLMKGLRDWMTKDARMTRERKKLARICCAAPEASRTRRVAASARKARRSS